MDVRPHLNCRLAICTNVVFPQTFGGSAKVSVPFRMAENYFMFKCCFIKNFKVFKLLVQV